MRAVIVSYGMLSMACADPEVPKPPAPGAAVVLDMGRALGVAWSPLWCRPSGWGGESCVRWLTENSEARFRWDHWRQPFEVGISWSRVSPVRAFDLRDSLRRALEQRGGRWVREKPWPADTVDRVHTVLHKWCLDGAVAWVMHAYQEGNPHESVDLLLAAAADEDCSPGAFAQQRRPNPRMQPTVRKGRDVPLGHSAP